MTAQHSTTPFHLLQQFKWLLNKGFQVRRFVHSTKDADTDKIWGMRQGAVEYLVKPIEDEMLVAKINAVLAG